MPLSVLENDSIAVLDMGSNSFHMVVARLEHGEIRTLQRFKEKVKLGEGLEEKGCLTEPAQQRALDCLRQFGQRLEGMPSKAVGAFATNALRVASNSRAFLRHAEQALGYPIEVISGVEEARLIYLGVAHTLPSDEARRLVIDIGGGSTEFILGKQFQPQLMESLPMGCVAYMDRFFKEGVLSKHNFQNAVNHASNELMRIRKRYRKKGWKNCYGSSGSIRAITEACRLINGDEKVDLPALEVLRDRLLVCENASDIEFEGISLSRRGNMVAALAILIAVFEALKVDEMEFSEGALREGALYDLVGRSEHEDVCLRSVQSMQHRFNIDIEQAERVQSCANKLFAQVSEKWKLADDEDCQLLSWGAALHEVGLSIAHVQFHKHGAYVLSAADMPGFTRQKQQEMAFLVRGHRRRFPLLLVEEFPEKQRERLIRLCLLLRLAVLFNRSRDDSIMPEAKLKVTEKKVLELSLKGDSFENFPLTFAELSAEAERIRSVGYELQLDHGD